VAVVERMLRQRMLRQLQVRLLPLLLPLLLVEEEGVGRGSSRSSSGSSGGERAAMRPPCAAAAVQRRRPRRERGAARSVTGRQRRGRRRGEGTGESGSDGGGGWGVCKLRRVRLATCLQGRRSRGDAKRARTAPRSLLLLLEGSGGSSRHQMQLRLLLLLLLLLQAADRSAAWPQPREPRSGCGCSGHAPKARRVVAVARRGQRKSQPLHAPEAAPAVRLLLQLPMKGLLRGVWHRGQWGQLQGQRAGDG
jgi:hypothetical protein